MNRKKITIFNEVYFIFKITFIYQITFYLQLFTINSDNKNI